MELVAIFLRSPPSLPNKQKTLIPIFFALVARDIKFLLFPLVEKRMKTSLELAKEGNLKIKQDKLFDDIYIKENL